MATYTFDKIEYNSNVYNVQDSGALQLTGGQVTGPVTFGDSVTIDEATVGDLVVNGSASVTNNLAANTINGVTVGSSPKFTDTDISTLTLASGSTAGTSLAYGGKYTLTAGSKTVSFTMPASDNTDTKVTSSANHYTPSTASGNDKTASASGATAAWSIDVVKGITINTDGKGHITGLSVTSGKIPANPNTDVKVKQLAAITTAGAYPVILAYSTATTEETNSVNKTSTLTYNPNTKALVTGGTVDGYTLAAASAKAVVTSIDTSASLPTSNAVKTFVEGKGYTTNTGTITGVTAGTGLSGGGTSGAVTLNHSNSVTAQTTQAVYPIKIDAQGHISAYGSAVTIPTDTNTWRKVQLDGTDKLGTAISTNPLNLKAGTNMSITESSGTFTFTATDTDTKVTSSANHYTPSTVSGNDKTASASGATAAWSIDVVKGITINTDGKGHITGLSVTSGKIPANPNTDSKLTVAAVTSGTQYYPVVADGANAQKERQVDTTGFTYKGTNGTTSAVGSSILVLGNSTGSGTANNKQAQLIMYGSNTKKATITLAAPSADIALALPTSGGTLALTSDIPDVSGFITTDSDEKVKSTTVTAATTYYLTGSTNTATETKGLSKHASIASYVTADSGTTGSARIAIGNATASGTAGAKYGYLRLYGDTAYYVDIRTEASTPAANRTIYLPSYTSTMYLTCTSTTDAVGGATTAPVYVDNTGRIQAVTSIPYTLLTGTPTIPTIPSNNVTGSGTSGYLAKWDGTNTITSGPQIGSGTTKFLREDGTWQTPSYTTNTDEKLKTAALTSGTTYYPILATGANAAANRQVDSTLGGLKYVSTAGTTSAVGTAMLYLGNATASGTANNEQGVIRLYGTTAYYTDIKAESGLPAANRTIYVPSYAGTMYLTCTSTTNAVGGSTTAPVYVDNTGRIQAVTSIPYSLLTGTPSTVSKTANGLCPQLPNETTTTKFLRQDGTWASPLPMGVVYTSLSNPGYTDATVRISVNYGYVWFMYTVHWSGFALNSTYTLGTLPEDARPSVAFYAPATIAKNDGTLNGPAQIHIGSDGIVTFQTGPSYSYTSGWAEVSVCYAL